MTTRVLHNAEAAVAKLTAFLREPVLTDRDRAGVIQAFEFTFEATWKLLKHAAEREGLATSTIPNSPIESLPPSTRATPRR